MAGKAPADGNAVRLPAFQGRRGSGPGLGGGGITPLGVLVRRRLSVAATWRDGSRDPVPKCPALAMVRYCGVQATGFDCR